MIDFWKRRAKIPILPAVAGFRAERNVLLSRGALQLQSIVYRHHQTNSLIYIGHPLCLVAHKKLKKAYQGLASEDFK